MNSDAPEGLVAPSPDVTSVVLIMVMIKVKRWNKRQEITTVQSDPELYVG